MILNKNAVMQQRHIKSATAPLSQARCPAESMRASGLRYKPRIKEILLRRSSHLRYRRPFRATAMHAVDPTRRHWTESNHMPRISLISASE